MHCTATKSSTVPNNHVQRQCYKQLKNLDVSSTKVLADPCDQNTFPLKLQEELQNKILSFIAFGIPFILFDQFRTNAPPYSGHSQYSKALDLGC